MSTKRKYNQSSTCDGGLSTTIVPPLPPPSKSPATSRHLPLPTSSAALSLASTIQDGGRSSSHHRSTLSTHAHQQQAISSTANALRAVEPWPATVPPPVAELSESEQHQRLKKRGRRNDTTVDKSGSGNQGNFYTHDGIGNEVGGARGNQSGATMSSNYHPHSAPQSQPNGSESNSITRTTTNNTNSFLPAHFDTDKTESTIFYMMQLNDEVEEHLMLYEIVLESGVRFQQKVVTKNGIPQSSLVGENEESTGVYHWDWGPENTVGQTGVSFMGRGGWRLCLPEGVKGWKSKVRDAMSILFTTEQCMGIMESPDFSDLFQQIVDMEFPRLVYYAEKQQDRKERISRQIIECLAAATSTAYTDRALEDLTEQPSEEIVNIVMVPKVDPMCSAVTKRGKTIVPLFTWGHKKSFLLHCKMMMNPSLPPGREPLSPDQQEFLHRSTNATNPDIFLQNHMHRRTIGGDGNGVTIVPFIDAVESRDNPRTIEMFEVVDALVDLFTEDVMAGFLNNGYIPQDIADAVNKIVNGITDEDYRSPEDSVLKEAYIRVLQQLSKDYQGRNDVIITLEQCAYESLQKDEAFNTIFPEGSVIHEQLDIDGDVAETIIETPTGPHYKIMYSSHIAFGHNNTTQQRVKAVKRTIASMALNNDAGILSEKDFTNEVNIYRSFLMNWFGLDGSENDVRGTFYGARDAAVGVGLCNPHFGRAGTQMTANRIGDGITQQAVIFLRTFLKRDRFDALLTCCGKPSSRANPSPLDDPLQREKWNQERQQEYRKKYYQDNRARIREQKRVYYQENREARLAYGRDNRDRDKERKQQRRESNKEKKARAEAERILKKAEVALTRYKKLKEAETLQQVTKDDMKSLLAYIVPLHPLDEHDKPTKYKNDKKMRERLGLPPQGGLHCEKDCLSNYFSDEWKGKWLARILE